MLLLSKWRYGPLLKHLVKDLEILRLESKMKAAQKHKAESDGNTDLMNRLNDELISEGIIFYAVKDSITVFCYKHTLKDPFAL